MNIQAINFIQIDSKDILFNATNELQINAKSILLGQSADQSAVLGQKLKQVIQMQLQLIDVIKDFMTDYVSHTHVATSLASPTSPPMIPVADKIVQIQTKLINIKTKLPSMLSKTTKIK